MVNEILTFWFGQAIPQGLPDQSVRNLWFKKSAETDDKIRRRFGGLVQSALDADGLSEWEGRMPDELALVILLDQFTRNIFRDTPRAFAGDRRAIQLVQAGVAEQREHQLPLIQRAFFYMPCMHSEEADIQKWGVLLFQQLAEEPTSDRQLREQLLSFHLYAEKHRDIVLRFGRFPHRNAVLNRESTPEELSFLKQPGSSF